MAASIRIAESRDMTPTGLFVGYDRFVGTAASFVSLRQGLGDIRLV